MPSPYIYTFIGTIPHRSIFERFRFFLLDALWLLDVSRQTQHTYVHIHYACWTKQVKRALQLSDSCSLCPIYIRDEPLKYRHTHIYLCIIGTRVYAKTHKRKAVSFIAIYHRTENASLLRARVPQNRVCCSYVRLSACMLEEKRMCTMLGNPVNTNDGGHNGISGASFHPFSTIQPPSRSYPTANLVTLTPSIDA